MRKAPYTPVKLYTDGLSGLAPGDFITTNAGSAYLVQEVRQSPSHEQRRYLSCVRSPGDEIPSNARRFESHWYSRNRRSPLRNRPALLPSSLQTSGREPGEPRDTARGPMDDGPRRAEAAPRPG